MSDWEVVKRHKEFAHKEGFVKGVAAAVGAFGLILGVIWINSKKKEKPKSKK